MRYIKNNSGTDAKSICAVILIIEAKKKTKKLFFLISRLQKVHLYKKSSSYTFVQLVTKDKTQGKKPQ